MKHIMGNSPKCNECKYYREREEGEVCKADGFCVLGHNTINGRRYKVERRAVCWNECCGCWIDAEEELIAYYEAVIGKPDPGKPPLMYALAADIITSAMGEQKKRRTAYNAK